MADFQFTQKGSEIQTILDSMGKLPENLRNAQNSADAAATSEASASSYAASAKTYMNSATSSEIGAATDAGSSRMSQVLAKSYAIGGTSKTITTTLAAKGTYQISDITFSNFTIALLASTATSVPITVRIARDYYTSSVSYVPTLTLGSKYDYTVPTQYIGTGYIVITNNATASATIGFSYEPRSGEDTDNAKYYKEQAEATVKTVSSDITHLSHSLNATTERLENVINELKGISYREVVDESLAQEKDVATNSSSSVQYTSGVEKYAEMTMLGGMSRKGKNLLRLSKANGITITTLNGITFTPQYCDDGQKVKYILINGTSTARTQVYYLTFKLKAGTYILSKGTTRTGAYIHYSGGYADSNNAENISFTISAEETVNFSLDIRSANETYDNVKIYPMLRLSSEPSGYEPYNGSNIIDAKVDEIDWIGECEELLSDSLKTWLTNNKSTWYTPSNVTTIVTTSGDALGKGTIFLHNNGTFISALDKSATYYANQYWLDKTLSGGTYKVIKDSTTDSEKTINIPQWSAYPKTIPSAAIALCPDYGIGINSSCYNYIDFENKVYHRKVGTVDLGNLVWSSFTTTGSFTVFQASLTYVANKINSFGLCSKYAISDNTDGYNGLSDKNFCGRANGLLIYFRDDAYTDASAFKTAVSGIMLYYELATEETVDLSSVLEDDDSILEVEGGGTLSFHYPSLDDGYVVDMPSKIVYDVDISQFS